jgi:hypothetical protein
MKLRLWKSKRERNIFIFSISLVVILYAYNFLGNKGTWKEDVDGDGIDEVVREIHSPDDRLLERLVTEEDGTIYRTVFSTDGHILFKWKMVPDSDNPDSYTIYIWDEETEQWLLDEDQDGILG